MRDDASHSDIWSSERLYELPGVQQLPGRERCRRASLYDYKNSNEKRAYKVSFDRPFTAGSTDPYENNNPLLYEHHLVRWLESQGYDVSYVTDVISIRHLLCPCNTRQCSSPAMTSTGL